MTDIVERLREGVWGRARRADAVIQAVMQEGADEIERLRTALHRISLASQDSGTTKESLGKEARDALKDGER